MIGLTAKGQQYAGIVLGVLLVVAVAWLSGRCSGERAAVTKQDTVAERVLKDSLDRVTAKLPALEKAVAAAGAASTRTGAPLARAAAHTDTAGAAEAIARAQLERAIADSLATLDSVKAAAQRLAVADSVAYAAVLRERDAAGARITALVRDSTVDDSLITAQSHALELAAEDRKGQAKIIADMQGEQHGLVHRVLDGALDVVAAGACGAAGSILSAAGAIVAGAACLAAAAAWAP